MRIYTAQDGLPPGPISALTASEADASVVCCASLSSDSIRVSRFDEKLDRWIALPPIPRDAPPAWVVDTPAAPEYALRLAANSKGEIFVAVDSERERAIYEEKHRTSPSRPIWRFDERRDRWDGMRLPGGRAGSVGVTLLRAVDGRLFAGTTAGFFAGKSDKDWETLVAEYTIHAAVPGRHGDWWLAVEHSPTRGMSLPQLLHIDETGKPLGRPMPLSLSNRPLNLSGIALTMSVNSSGVLSLWAVLTSHQMVIQGDIGWTQTVTMVDRLNAASGVIDQTVTVSKAADLANLPEEVLDLLLPRDGLGPRTADDALAAAVHQHFAAFDSPPQRNAVLPADLVPATVTRGVGGIDADGATWDTGGRTGLVRVTPAGTVEEIPAPTTVLPTYSELSGVGLTGNGTLLALTTHNLLRKATSPASGIGAFNRAKVQGENEYGYGYQGRVCANAGGYWIATDGFADYADSAGKSSPAFTTLEQGQRLTQELLGVRADGMAWINQRDAGIALVGMDGKRVRQVVPSALPLSEAITRLMPIPEVGGAMGDTLWYTGTAHADTSGARTALIGFDSVTGQWMLPHLGDVIIALWSGQDEVKGSTGESAASTWALAREERTPSRVGIMRWQPSSAGWSRVGPPLPAEVRFDADCLRIVRARPDDVWIVDRNQIVLYHWDGRSTHWETHAAPPGSGIRAGNTVIDAGCYDPGSNSGSDPDGPTIHVAGITGLWDYRIGKKAWQHVPLPTIGVWSVGPIVDGGPTALWSALRSQDQRTAGARLDKVSRTWTVYSEAQGFPKLDPSDDPWVPDAVDPAHFCWLISVGHVYRFDGTRWRDRTAEVTGGDAALAPNRIVSDPNGDAWILLGPTKRYLPSEQRKMPHANAPVAALWDRKTDSFAPCRPGILGRKQAVYTTNFLRDTNGDALLTTTAGAFRENAGTHAWYRVEIPGFSERPIYAVHRETDGLWFVGDDLYARLRSAP